MNGDKATKLVVALLVGGLMAAFLLPIAIGAISGPDTLQATQNTGETITLQGDLTATLDDVNENTNATYTVSNDADTASVTVAEGGNETVTVDGNDVNIQLDNAMASSATTTYEFPKTYGWGSGASSLWAILPIMMVLGVFLLFTGMALKARN